MSNEEYWVPLRYEAWLVGTQEMTMEQRGFYITIISMLYTRDGWMADDELALSKRMGLRPSRYRRLRDELIAMGKLYIPARGFIGNRTVDRVVAAQKEASKRGREAAMKRWAKRAGFSD